MNRADAWTEEQYQILLTYYPYERSKDVALRIGRTKGAVDHMASRLKIQKDALSMSAIYSKSKRGENAPNFKGYRRNTTKGYITLYRPDEKGTDKNGMIMEHRYIMAKHIGREITPDEAVHHINGIRTDNRIENLQLMEFGQHSALHNRERKRA